MHGSTRKQDSTRFLILGLAFLALAQGLLLFRGRGWDGMGGPRWPHAGDFVGGIVAVGAEGEEASLATGDTAVFLVFSPDCAHCRKVAPAWREWTEDSSGERRVVALSTAPRRAAQAYASQQGWQAEVWSVAVESQSGQEHALTARTPWVFVVDPHGVILAEGHGAHLAELAGGVGA